MIRFRLARYAGPVLAGMAAACLSTAASAIPIAHEIVFTPDSGPSFSGTLTVDDSQLIPNNQISCPSECLDLGVVFAPAFFDLGDLIENFFANTDATGQIATMNVLMLDTDAPGASDYELDMNTDGSYEISVNPTVSQGTYAIQVVPEPTTAALLGLSLLGLGATRLRARR